MSETQYSEQSYRFSGKDVFEGVTSMIEVRPYETNNNDENYSLIPHYIAPSVKDIDFRLLSERYGSRALCIDIDNTITRVGSNHIDDPEVQKFLKSLIKEGVLESIYLASRSGRNVKAIEEAIGAKSFSAPSGFKKPQSAYFEALLKAAGCLPHQAIMVGDRLTHDTKGAVEVGFVTVLVKPIGKGMLHGWIPQDFFGVYQKEKHALGKLQEVLLQKQKTLQAQ